jgi:hypothetical protein
MKNLILILGLFFISSPGFSPGFASGKPSSPRHEILAFYRAYLPLVGKPEVKKPALPLSKSFSGLIQENEKICREKAGTDVCGWGADGDVYLNAQEYEAGLDEKRARLKVTEPSPGQVRVKLNVYPALKDSGTHYDREITYQMIRERGRWVVDDILYGKVSSRKTIREETDSYLKSGQSR